jgi:hypothetical protein
MSYTNLPDNAPAVVIVGMLRFVVVPSPN